MYVVNRIMYWLEELCREEEDLSEPLERRSAIFTLIYRYALRKQDTTYLLDQLLLIKHTRKRFGLEKRLLGICMKILSLEFYEENVNLPIR